MSTGFSFQGWASQVTQRLNRIEAGLRNGQVPKNGKTGLSDLEPREAEVLKRAFVGLETEFDQIRSQFGQVVAERNDLVTLFSQIEGSNRHLEDGYNTLETRLRELSFHVQSYVETINGVAIRPERAVSAIAINPKTGAPELNQVKVHTKAFFLAATPRGAVTVPANGSIKINFIVPPEQNYEGDFEAYFLEAASFTSPNFRVRVNHTGIGKILTGIQPVHGLAVFGSMLAGPQPFQSYESIFLQPNQALEVEIFDFSGAPNLIELVAHGRKFVGYTNSDMDRAALINAFSRNTWPCWLTTDTTITLNASTTQALGIQFSQERAFHAEYGKIMQFGTNGGLPAPVFYHLQLNEGASGHLIADNVPIHCMAGNGNFPFPLPEPYLAIRGTILTGQITNDSGLANLGSDIVLHGRAIPLSIHGQRTLEPAFDARSIQLPPSHKDLAIPMAISR